MEKTEGQVRREKIIAEKKKKEKEQKKREDANRIKKALKMIEWRANHPKRSPYDYGSGVEETLEDIRGILNGVRDLLYK